MPYPSSPGRYRLTRSSDGRIRADDTMDPLRHYVLTPRPAVAPAYVLSVSGALLVRTGRIVDVTEPARSTGYDITRARDGTVRLTRVDNMRWQLSLLPSGGAMPRDRFAIVDLRDGRLLVLDARGVQELSVQQSFSRTSDLRAFRSGRTGSTSGTRSGGGDPTYDIPDDFMP